MIALILALAASEAGDQKADAPPKSADVGPMRTATLIDHTPLEKSARGLSIIIKARIENPSTLFLPQVYARPAGSKRYQGYTMQENRKGKTFQARLPASLLNEGAVEYFIEARSDDGGASRAGSPAQPFSTVAYDPPPVPVSTTFRTDMDGADVKIDGDLLGKTPLTVTLAPGPHTITISAPDGRSTEQQIDVKSGQHKLNLNIPLPSGEGGGLQVVSEPAGARVFVDGVAVGSTPYSGPIEPGEHVVRVEAEGRMRQERQVSARPGRDESLSFALPPLPKDPALSIESDPVGALVTIDGKEKGRTPYLAPLSAGPHSVVLKLEGRRSVGTDFNMPKDRDMSLRLELPAGGSTSGLPRLSIASTPPGASVTIDGADVGFTPWADDIKPGDRKVKVALQGFKADERKVTVTAGRDAEIAFNLTREPGPGKLRLETDPPEAIVTIDGQQVGTTPYTGDVAPGDHQLEVALENFRGVAQPFTLEPGQQLSLKLALQPAGAERVPPLIAVASDPQGAQLFVDGKLAGTTPVKVRSTPGAHEIKLVLDGYTNRVGKINLPDSKDFELRMAISLKPLRGTAVVQSAVDPTEVARAQLKRAASCYRQGDYKCALEGYQAAYEFKAVPELLYNIAQTRRRKGDYKEASAAYGNFIKETSNPKMRAEAEKYQALCEMQLDPSKASTSLALASAGGPVTAAQHGEMPTITGPNGPGLPPPNPNSTATDGSPANPANPATAQANPANPAGATNPDGTPAANPSNPGANPANAAQAAQGQSAVSAAPAQKANLFGAVEEDQDPPIITHTAVTKAIRGQPLRLSARIVDERSDVGTAQACWKNLFKPDYTCAQLIRTGEDKFEVEVPAKAVTDGFSYYLEAYDTSENGPARAGAPELPNAVAIDEAPPPKPVEQPKVEPPVVAQQQETRPPAPDEAVGSGQKPGQVPEQKNHILSYIAIGGAVAAVGAGIGLNYHAQTQLNSLTEGGHSTSEIDSITNQANTEKVVGYALFGLGGALVLGAIAFWNVSF
ncbi:MAG: PEGA domain-containing protein [Deltaproteobacteria bacterium]|nr:PEGA domain-containing protein [Deltaproteobacteria bacterium]